MPRSSRKSSKRSAAKKSNPWRSHLKKVYAAGKRKDKHYSLEQAMKEASKTYKKSAKKSSPKKSHKKRSHKKSRKHSKKY